MSRAVFLSSCGDPFLTLFVHQLFRERWYNEADKIYVDYNNHAEVPLAASQECCSRLMEDPKVQLIYHPNGIGNGMPITEMTLLAKEDLVMLLEDDGFIFEKGIVNECFQKIEVDQTDAVGSPRGSCGKEVWDAMQKKYNLDYTGYGDVGPNFWPNFFFCKRADLLKTDLNFASKSFLPDEYYKELDHTFTEINHGDTFVWGCIQLRHMGVRFFSVSQYHASPTEPEDKQQKVMNWITETPRWIHGGSLSAGWGGYLNKQLPPTKTDMEKREIESRVAFWTIASDVVDGFEDFKKEYKVGITELIHKGGLQFERIQEKVNLYKTLMKL